MPGPLSVELLDVMPRDKNTSIDILSHFILKAKLAILLEIMINVIIIHTMRNLPYFLLFTLTR